MAGGPFASCRVSCAWKRKLVHLPFRFQSCAAVRMVGEWNSGVSDLLRCGFSLNHWRVSGLVMCVRGCSDVAVSVVVVYGSSEAAQSLPLNLLPLLVYSLKAFWSQHLWVIWCCGCYAAGSAGYRAFFKGPCSLTLFYTAFELNDREDYKS
ncbi:hypothetical protein IGI04_036748 [Brassica rapa subsp. trilocularis]|uniref:Uncharacterized protein n=1 Tax=Brassica rapa subsp. trilocularis TaxID=1813537 RepID=A0ABQ7LFC4_BRACM|nr:hypothetical protein IGI04_036748 [Brassica rapa subsp. trilocularis]